MKFPGYSGDEEEEERLSAIEVFSESESDVNQDSDRVDGKRNYSDFTREGHLNLVIQYHWLLYD